MVVISDLHLGTRGCRADELLLYLKSIDPEILILNGDIVDGWQFKKNFWPSSHMKIVKQIVSMAAHNTEVYYITGNHDEIMRKLSGLRMGAFHVVNQMEFELNGKKTWFFHGDVFDVVMQHSPWLAKAGAFGYDSLIFLNNIINRINRVFGKGPISFSRKIKDNVKSAVKFINNFEKTAANLAARKGFDAIVCGHIHHPEIKTIQTESKEVQYLNSGDWIENLSALEYHNDSWRLFLYEKELKNVHHAKLNGVHERGFEEMPNKEVFRLMLKDFES